jgi:O-antigen/teichoic acid export membrane protein
MNKYFKAISTNFIFLFITTICFIILTPLAIRIMGDEFFGLWSVVYSIMLFSNIGSLGIGSIVNKFAAESLPEINENHSSDIIVSAFVIILPMAIITAAILWISSDLIAQNLSISLSIQNQISTAIKVCAIGIIPLFLAKIPQGFLLSQYKNTLARTMDFVANIFPWVGAILICTVQKNLIWIAWWFVIVQVIIVVIYSLSIRNNIKWNIRPKLSIIRRMTNFSSYMFIESTAISLFQQFDRVIVGLVLGPVMAGVYSVGTSVSLRLPIVVGQATEIMIPYASFKDSLGDQQRLYFTFRSLSRFISIILSIISSLAILWMHEILSLWISPEYADRNTDTFRILIIAYTLLSLCRSGHQTLTGMGKVKFTSLIYLFSSIFMLVTLYILSRYFGLIGAASANLVMVFLLLFNLYVYKNLNRKIRWKVVLADLGWGIFLPICIFLLSLIYPIMSTMEKIILSLIICITLFIVMLRDEYIRNRFSFILRSLQKV